MLDFDGVIRVPSSGLVLTPDHFEFCPDRMRDLAKVCETLDLKIVVSSDWRNFEKKGEIERLIGPLARYLHEDWMTPVIGHRWQEVAFWIMRHEPDTYIILEDLEMHYEDASPEMKKRIVWCETHKGITKKQIKEIYDKYE